MINIPLVSSSSGLGERIREATTACRHRPPDVLELTDRREAEDYLSIEMPELMLIQFPDVDLGAYALLDTIMQDPWLIHGGIIALCDDDDDVERLESLQGANLVVTLSPESIGRQLPQVLDIIHDNRRILFQRELGSILVHEVAGQFKLGNDPLEARCYTNLACNFLYNANRIDVETKDALNLALYEMLMNAVEHGNCGISYEEKNAWLQGNGSLAQLIRKRCEDPVVAGRRVTFEYTIGPDRSRFTIADQGGGFDWRRVKDATAAANLLEAHGRGIMLTKAVTSELSYNEKGNEVSFEIAHQADRASSTPRLLEGIPPRSVAAGETVFQAGTPGDSLFFIASGRFDVIVGGRTIATLTPDDIFLGEMSFLLNNRRTASVRASTDGRLIEIHKKNFVEAIQKHPHYALLLARLLARRIERANALQVETSLRRA